MGGVIRGIRRAVGGVVRGVGSAVGGVVRGVGYLAQGKLGKAVGSVVGGVVKGTGHVLKGGLGAVKDVLGDPIIGAAAGFALMGPAGLLVGPALGKLGSKIAGSAERGVGHLFGLNGRPQMQHMNFGHNHRHFGPYNGHMGGQIGGLYPPMYGSPFGGSPFGGMPFGSPFGGMPFGGMPFGGGGLPFNSGSNLHPGFNYGHQHPGFNYGHQHPGFNYGGHQHCCPPPPVYNCTPCYCRFA